MMFPCPIGSLLGTCVCMNCARLAQPQCNLNSVSVVAASDDGQHRCCFSSIDVILHHVGSPRTTADIRIIDEGCCCRLKGSWLASCRLWTHSRLWAHSRWFNVHVAVILSVEADIAEERRLTTSVEYCASQVQLLSTKYAEGSGNGPVGVSSRVCQKGSL